MQTSIDSLPRVALFPDTFHETNGVATLSRHLVHFAHDRGIALLVVRGGDETQFTNDGSVATLELKRGPTAFALDKGLYCDPLLMRHKKLVLQHLSAFKPDLVHITGPGDLGFLGLWLSHILHIPLVASWHTNLHEYLGRRLDGAFHVIPKKWRHQVTGFLERQGLRGLLRFYKTARFTLAPNQTMVNLLNASTARPSFLMAHGVDLVEYSPKSKQNDDGPFCIGYVGRLTAEKSVRDFVSIEGKLIAAGEHNYKFLIVGEGSQQKWLAKHLRQAEFAGVLRGTELASAYRRMDAFIFPSRTDTFGLVILEALASGVPVVLSPEAGIRLGMEDGVSGLLSDDFAADLQRLIHDRALRITLSSGARLLARRHSWDTVFEQLYSTYVQGLSMSHIRLSEVRA